MNGLGMKDLIYGDTQKKWTFTFRAFGPFGLNPGMFFGRLRLGPLDLLA